MIQSTFVTLSRPVYAGGKRETREFEVVDYSIQMDSVPTVGVDTSGSVGVTRFTAILDDVSSFNYRGAFVKLSDSTRGDWYGYVKSVDENYGNGTTEFVAHGVLDIFNLQNVSVPPMKGTLAQMLKSWVDLIDDKNVTVEFDSSLPAGTYAWPGWSGEMWTKFKEVCVAYKVGVSVNGTTIRVGRERSVASTKRLDRELTEFSISQETFQPSSGVDLTWYETRWADDTQAYPAKGLPLENVLSVSAGEFATHELETAMSLKSVVSVSFNVVADNQDAISTGRFTSAGGAVKVRISDDTRRLIVELTGPTGLRNSKGELYNSFSLTKSLGRLPGEKDEVTELFTDDDRGITVRASGVLMDKRVATARTGVDERLAQQDVDTGENIFLRFHSDAYRVAAEQAGVERGIIVSSSGGGYTPYFNEIDTLIGKGMWRIRELTINPSGYDFRADSALTYDDVKSLLTGMTYNSVQSLIRRKITSYDDLMRLRFFSD